jgi:ABC-type sugar transport system substrate-binding protein
MKMKFRVKNILVLALAVGCVSAFGADKKIVVGFSQIGAESGWRTANTESIKSEAAAASN